jgi:PPE-repeat protein
VTSPHFAWLPPEINSALLFDGPGSAPLLAAAAAWDGLAEDLASSASSFFSVTSDLANGSWQGASAAAMMGVATQYVSWLTAAAAQAEAASSQAAAIAAAFETALAATVQPAVVAANRTLVQALAATNWFGFNIPAIMDTEAAYEAMWAADVAAMFGYHADASAAASQLSPWQMVLQKLGFQFNNGQMTFQPFGNTQAGSTSASSSGGSGTSGSGNAGSGTSGSSNVGFGNQGSGNVGFGNTGNNDFGIGLTGNNQIGIGAFSTGFGGTGNIGLFNSGTGNAGILNSGSSHTGFTNLGSANPGLFSGAANPAFFQDAGLASQASAAQGIVNPSHYVTGSLSAANLSSGLLNTVSASTGLNSAIGSGLLNPALANAAAFTHSADAGSVESGANTSIATAVNGPTPTPPALRTTTSPSGYFGSGGRDSAIPSSGFFGKGDPAAAGPSGIREPGLSD